MLTHPQNQFFISGQRDNQALGNRIADALARRILRAHINREPFHVMVSPRSGPQQSFADGCGGQLLLLLAGCDSFIAWL